MSAPFLDSSNVVREGNALQPYNYQQISANLGEFMLSSNWDFKWTSFCNAVYFPGNEFTRLRLTSFNPTFPSEIGDIVARMRNGYEIHQKTWSGTTSGTFQCTYMDCEDQGIHAWLWDWREKYGDMQNRVQFRTEDTIANAEALLFNSSRIPIRRYSMYTVQLSEAGLPNLYSPSFTSEDPTNLGECTPTFQFNHWELNFLNV